MNLAEQLAAAFGDAQQAEQERQKTPPMRTADDGAAGAAALGALLGAEPHGDGDGDGGE